ncbi:UNVERIFIED_CONTAM: putative damage-inducible protein DinB [Brevibacillus sp. OAP136]
MIRTTTEFLTEWKSETEATQRLLDVLTDESLGQAMTPDHRTLGQIAWHLVWVLGSMTQLGLDFPKPDGEELAPSSAEKIASEYKRVSQQFAEAVESQWNDETIQENAAHLRLLIQHEVHHRGQMTVLMRQAGLPIAGVYGPSKEEWIVQGKEPYL